MLLTASSLPGKRSTLLFVQSVVCCSPVETFVARINDISRKPSSFVEGSA